MLKMFSRRQVRLVDVDDHSDTAASSLLQKFGLVEFGIALPNCGYSPVVVTLCNA